MPPGDYSGGVFCFWTISVLKTCGMWSKLYLALLGLSIAVMAFFSIYSWSWLQSIGNPSGAAAGYVYHADLAWNSLWLTTAILILVGNAVLWTGGRAWAMWITFVYFTVLAVLRFFWLDEAFVSFKKVNGLSDGGFSVGPFVAVLLIVIIAAIVFFDQFIVSRLRHKMYPPTVADEPPTESKPSVE